MIRNLLLTGLVVASSAVTIAAPASPVVALDNTPWRLPVTPPRCTTAQIDSGDVAGCLLVSYDEPADIGWGSPPAPGVGTGWEWNGYWYNGSPALAGWESTYIGANAEPVAGLARGTLRTHVGAQLLFEGFLDEISAKGYRVADAGGYAFRCTSGNGGWSCPSGDPTDLSLHAWGLAIDMNAATNPIRSYTGIGGATACATPIETDLPRWVIQTAEKWGLYWGGYGWNSGCADQTTLRTVVSRDPPHFEFRGTPEQALAIAQFNYGDDPRLVCFPIVDDDGNDTERCGSSRRPPAATRMAVDLPAPAGAAAAVINVTAAEAAAPGFFTLEDCGPQPAIRTTSALSYAPGEAVATMAIVPLDAQGRFCVFRSAAVHSIVDVVAYLGGDGSPMWFQPSAPRRLLDTRRTDEPLAAGDERTVPTRDGATRIVNLVGVEAAGPGYLQTGRCGTLGGDADFSNLNATPGSPRSNLALMPGSETDGSCVFSITPVDVAVDELGRLDATDGLGWQLAPPRRVLDTRRCTAAWCDGRPAAGTVIPLDLGTEAPGAAIAITVTGAQARGHVSVGSCADLAGGAPPSTSNLNYVPGRNATNLAFVALDAGELCVYTFAGAHVVIDVQAELVADHAVGMLPVTPARAHDSRDV